MTEEEIDKMADDFVNSQEFTKVYGIARKAECGAFWKKGFLAREKYIADLEKENAELRNNGFTVSAMTEQQLKVALEKGEQLEKENAELKHTIAELRRDKDNLNTHTKAQEKLSEYRSDQLTKAKEIIKDLLSLCEGETDSKLVFTRAEQFLKEVEK